MAGWPSRPKHVEGAGSWGARQVYNCRWTVGQGREAVRVANGRGPHEREVRIDRPEAAEELGRPGLEGDRPGEVVNAGPVDEELGRC
jgi:hypothetical protein